jgi:hypothetical protein
MRRAMKYGVIRRERNLGRRKTKIQMKLPNEPNRMELTARRIQDMIGNVCWCLAEMRRRKAVIFSLAWENSRLEGRKKIFNSFRLVNVSIPDSDCEDLATNGIAMIFLSLSSKVMRWGRDNRTGIIQTMWWLFSGEKGLFLFLSCPVNFQYTCPSSFHTSIESNDNNLLDQHQWGMNWDSRVTRQHWPSIGRHRSQLVHCEESITSVSHRFLMQEIWNSKLLFVRWWLISIKRTRLLFVFSQ